MLELDVSWVSIVVGSVLPLVVAIVKSQGASAAWGAWLLAALNALTAGLTMVIDNSGTLDWNQFAQIFVVQFIVAISAYYGFWKPTAVADNEGAIMSAIPSGLGKPGA